MVLSAESEAMGSGVLGLVKGVALGGGGGGGELYRI